MKHKIKKGIMIAFGELFLKSKRVRTNFIRKLINNLNFCLNKKNIEHKVYFLRDRIFVETEKINMAKKIIKQIPGISLISESFYCLEGDLNELFEFIENNYSGWISKNQKYALRVKIEDLKLKSKKEKIIDELACLIKRKVNLSKPDKEINIEIKKNGWLVYLKKEKAKGGLPQGSGGRVLTMMSGGIDSPVASYIISKRGVENVWVHFHSFPLASKQSIEKVEELAKEFLRFQPKLRVYFVPFSKAQSKIKVIASPQYRVLLYRRLMFKIAEKIRGMEDCRAFVTGESLGQVSSQTIENISITQEPVRAPVFRPLIAMDKEEIIEVSRKNGFYDISIKPQEDCCTLFISKHQTAKGSMKEVKEAEKKIDIKKIITECLKEMEVKDF